MSRIIGESAGNFSLKQPGFTYAGITIDCDSKLECAAVIYLVDEMGATNVERGTAILNYHDAGGGRHRFLPDFYVTIGDNRWLVEVKQVKRESPNIDQYTRYLTEKKAALVEFCERKGLQPLWLDFDHDDRFRLIYQRFIGRK